MNKKSLPFALLLWLPGVLMAYTISVKGIVYNSHDQGVSGALVKVKSAVDDPFQVDLTLIADDQGIFSLALEVPDDVSKGTLIFTIDGCGQANTKRIVYHSGHLDFSLKLKDCHAVNDHCGVRIKAERLDDLTLQLTAHAKGSEPFSYQWSTGETSHSIIIEDPGLYYVMVTAADGCQAKDAYNHHTDKKCATEIHIAPAVDVISRTKLVARTKGLEPFTYQWSTGEVTPEIIMTGPGEYCVTVVDATGCESRDCKTIKEPSCQAEIHAVQASPNSDLADLHLVARSHGWPPFKYLWSTGDTTKMIRVSGGSGEFCVKVTDALGCESKACILLDPATDCKTEIAVIPNLTSANAGIHLSARTQGRPPFSYKWSTGDTSKNLWVDQITEYCVEVVDGNGCISTDCIDLAPIGELCSVTIHRTSSAALIAKPRGFAPFKILWSTGDTARVVKPDATGEYCVTVVNAFGCEARACVSITPDTGPCHVKIQRKPTDIEGSIELVARIAINTPYKYLWNTGETTESIIASEDGEYCVEAYNATCRTKECVDVKIGQGISFKDAAAIDLQQSQITSKKPTFDLLAFPNPVINDLQLQWKSPQTLSDLTLIVNHISGKPLIIHRLRGNSGSREATLDLRALEPGVYIVQIIGEGVSEQRKIFKSQ